MSSVEFALILPLLLVLLFGLIDFGRMGYVQINLTAASREGARLSSLSTSGIADSSLFQSKVREFAPDVAGISQLSIGATLGVSFQPCNTNQDDENTSVTVSSAFNWTLPVGLWALLAPNSSPIGSFALSSTSVARCIS